MWEICTVLDLDIVNGSLCNLFALVFSRASVRLLHRADGRDPTRSKQLSTVATLLYRFLSCRCLAKFTFLRGQISPCSLLYICSFFWVIRSLVLAALFAVLCRFYFYFEKIGPKGRTFFQSPTVLLLTPPPPPPFTLESGYANVNLLQWALAVTRPFATFSVAPTFTLHV